MLILSRKSGESIVIGGDVTVTVLDVRGSVVRLGIAAPKEISVHRSEVQERIRVTGAAPELGRRGRSSGQEIPQPTLSG